MDFLSGQEDVTTAGLSYSFRKIDLDLSAEELTLASTSNSAVSPEFTVVPPEVPARVQEIARAVTEGYSNRYQRAVALQNWFREDGGFTYSLATDGSGTDDLLSFLEEGEDGRTGYCEQFASAMAIMARTLGIPARVAVGFLSGEAIGGQRWQFSAHDMHAWPELFFPGSGWVRFEPTPSAGPATDVRATTVPPYTDVDARGPAGALGRAERQPGHRGAAEPRRRRAERRRVRRRHRHRRLGRHPRAVDVARPGRSRRSRSCWSGSPTSPRCCDAPAGNAAGAPVVRRSPGRSCATPPSTSASSGDRGSRRGPCGPASSSTSGRRPTPGTPERPPRGPSANPRAVDALDRIVHEVELLRYARTPGSPDANGLRFDTELCGSALAGGATRAARRRALWWPRSLFSRQARPRPGASGNEPTMSHGVLVDHVG